MLEAEKWPWLYLGRNKLTEDEVRVAHTQSEQEKTLGFDYQESAEAKEDWTHVERV